MIVPLHCFAGIQRRKGILKDDLHAPTEMLHLLTAHGGKIDPIEQDAAGSRFLQSENKPSQRGFTASGLAHESQGLPANNLKVHVVYCMHMQGVACKEASAHRKIFDQFLDANQFVAFGEFN